jgi:hypothetical protein
MQVIVITFHSKNLDAITGMIWRYAGPKGGVIFDHRHNPEYRAGNSSETTKRSGSNRWPSLL